MTDKETETKDEVKTTTPSTPTPEEKKPSPKAEPETYTQAQADKLVEDALKREGGRINKTMEERVNFLETENLTLKDGRLTDAGKEFGLTLEDIKGMGIDNPTKVAEIAAKFGKTATPPLKLDPGTTTGGGKEMPESAKGKMRSGFDELNK